MPPRFFSVVAYALSFLPTDPARQKRIMEMKKQTTEAQVKP